MKYDYKLTLADYKSALVLHQRATRSRRILEFFLYKLMPVLASAAIVWEIYREVTLNSFAWEHMLRLLVVPAFFMLLPISRSNLIRKQFKQMFPKGSENLSIDINDDRILCENTGSSESRYTWNAITSFAQDEKIAMFYLSAERFLFFPMPGLSLDQVTELRDLVRRNLGDK